MCIESGGNYFQHQRILSILNGKLDYRKIPIISPGLIFVQKAVLLGLFSGGGGAEGRAYYWKEFCVSKRGGLTTSFPVLFPFELGRPNSKGKSTGNEVGGLTIKQLALTCHVLIFGRAYYRKDFCF